MKTRKGYTTWANQVFESEVFRLKPAEWFKIWFFIVGHVNYEDTNLFPRGSNFFQTKRICDETRTTRDQVDKFLRWSREQSMLATSKTTRGIIITVLNYAKYQDQVNYKSDTKSEIKAKQKRHYKRNKETIKQLSNSKTIISPWEEAAHFFSGSPPIKDNTISWVIKEKGFSPDGAQQLLDEFTAYWTEGTRSGKPLWETMKAFELRKRLARWIGNQRTKNGPKPVDPRIYDV